MHARVRMQQKADYVRTHAMMPWKPTSIGFFLWQAGADTSKQHSTGMVWQLRPTGAAQQESEMMRSATDVQRGLRGPIRVGVA